MSIKNKNTNNVIKRSLETLQRVGTVGVVAVATLGLIELPDHDARVVMPNQATPAVIVQPTERGSESTMRREREETGPHYVSYGASQRTVAHTGA